MTRFGTRLWTVLALDLVPAVASAQQQRSAVPAPEGALELTMSAGYAQGIGRVASSLSPTDLARRRGMGFDLEVGYRLSPPELGAFVYFGIQGRFDIGGRRADATP